MAFVFSSVNLRSHLMIPFNQNQNVTFNWVNLKSQSGCLVGWSTHLRIPKNMCVCENDLIITGDLSLKIKKIIYFHKRPASFDIQRLTYFNGNLSFFKFQKELQQAFMLPWNFSIFTNDLFILRFKNWSIFMDDLPFCNFKRNFYQRSCFLENGLFSWVNCPFWN